MLQLGGGGAWQTVDSPGLARYSEGTPFPLSEVFTMVSRPHVRNWSVLFGLALAVLSGCDSTAPPPPGSAQADGDADSSGQIQVTGDESDNGYADDYSNEDGATADAGALGGESPYGTPDGSYRPGPPATNDSNQRTEVKLSTCVALGQTLPTGTCMSFSVEYRVIGPPNPDARYYWVIEPKRGEPLAQPCQLQARGTLQGIAQELRPEHGPFYCHIVEEYGGQRRKVSKSYPMPAIGRGL